MSDLSGRLAALSPEKRALLALRMKQKEQSSQRPPLVPGSRSSASFPLSFTQERLWFLDQLDPGSPIYNVPTALRYSGPLDHPALERALTEVVRRHEALRTVFVDTADVASGAASQPAQQINPAEPVTLPLIDLQALPEAEREAEAQRLATAEALRPFDLRADLLLRGQLLRLGPTEHIHLITMHHIVSDGWSSGVFVRELAALYAAFTRGESAAAAQLPPLPIQYVDFAAWQRQWLRGALLDKQLSYWREQLADAPALLELPTDRPRPAIQTSHGTTESLRLAPELTAELHTLSQREGVTLFMTLLAAFKTLLYRTTGETDLVVGSPIAGRDQVETQGLIGFFVNMLVLRTSLDDSPSMRDLLQRVRQTALGAYAHQDVPFEMVVETVQPERSLSYTPLFQVAFALQNAPMEPLQLKDLTVHPPAAKTGVAKYDLYLELTEERGVLTAVIEYNTDLFDAATIARVLSQYETLLRAMIADPACSIATLPLLTPAAERQILVDFNTTAAAPALDRSVQQLFEERAARNPERIAAQCGPQRISYGALNRRANQTARWMTAQGLGRGDRIGLLGGRGIEMLATILASFKIGAAYVPLDPSHPDARIATVIEGSALQLIVTEASLVERSLMLAQSSPATPGVLCWEQTADDSPVADRRALDAQSDADLPLVGQPRDLANIFFTSGSTGTPKGVMVEQIGMLNHLWAKIGALELDEHSVVAQNASHCFDISVWQFLAALLVGGRVAIYDQETALEPGALLQAVERDGVTVLETVPTMLDAMLLAVAEPDSQPITLPALRYLVSNAETLPVPLARRWIEQFPAVPLVNTYGATECSDDTTHYVIREQLPADLARVPVGTPIPGFTIYVLDGLLRPVPIGVPGQIAMAGVGVGQGYLGDAQKTAAAFVPDPFDGSNRLYLTGDTGRWNADGQLEFLGRQDGQVKIRGHRVEIGEVEAALARVEGVRQAIVLAWPDRRGQLSLIGYVVAETALDPRATRALLQTMLPAAMVPEQIISLEAFPVNRNGKVDRRALPAPDGDALSAAASFVAPSTPTEEVIAGIWAHVLGQARVGVNQNFFELGGHSLLATQVISRVRAAFMIDLPLRALFEQPTVAGLAATVEHTRQHAASIPPIVRVARDGELAASFAQQRLWFLEQYEAGTPVYHMPTALRLSGALDSTALAHALSTIVERHEVLRTTFRAVDGQPWQVIHAAQPVSLPQIDLTDWPGDQDAEAFRLLTAAVQQPFDIERGPLLRALLLRLDADEHVLLIVVHHIVSDGWSTGVLLSELAALYPAAAAGQPAALEPLPIQYADFAAWQRQWLAPGTAEGVLEQQLGYWRDQLAGSPPLLELPTDRPRPAVQTFVGAVEKRRLSPALTAELHTLSQREGVTLFMTLLAGLKIVLARSTDQDDLLVGTPIAGRTRSETEALIGFFVNTLVLRTDLSNNPSVRELLGRVRETALGAYAHQDVPFEMVVETVQPERSLSHTPLFQVLCVLNNTAALPDALGDVRVTPLTDGGTVAKFDLTLALSEDECGLTAALEYNIDLFDAATIERMLGHFETILQAMVADVHQPIATLPLLTAVERELLLVTANATARPYPREISMYELFEQHAARTPDAIAVVSGRERLSYRELNARANQLAHHLRAEGVGPEVVVGLCVDRSASLLVAVLGILKAGGAYLPLDPTYPADRLAFMLQDADVPLLVTEQTLLGTLPGSTQRSVCLDRDWNAIARQPATNLGDVGPATRLAYLIYTSGSTGMPKGVQIAHRSVVNVIEDMRTELELTERDRLLAITSLSFDISVVDLFLPLSYGATIEMVSRTMAADGPQLLALLRSSGTTILQATPSSWRMLLQAGWSAETPLRVAITGGEALTPELAAELLPRTARLWNYYGPTEATIWSSFKLIHTPADAVSIGVPLANTQLYVLDRTLQPVPVGVTGELYIGGDGLARGYLNRPELTAERFIQRPPALGTPADTDARIYKTGDSVRFQADGSIAYIGRLDHQVKLRGFRIELGEIENVLRQHPTIGAATVIVREDPPAAGGQPDPRLVAYIVPRDTLPTVDALRLFVQQHLPLYMVPTAFVELQTLPLTPNGKLDRKALPAPDMLRPALEREYVAPETPSEIAVAAIWAELLGVATVGVHDNFFALGGHSLLATQLMARIAATCGVDLPLRALFEQPTVAALALSIDREQSDAPAEEDLSAMSDLVDLLDGLSEAEVEALLAQKLLSIREDA